MRLLQHLQALALGSAPYITHPNELISFSVVPALSPSRNEALLTFVYIHVRTDRTSITIRTHRATVLCRQSSDRCQITFQTTSRKLCRKPSNSQTEFPEAPITVFVPSRLAKRGLGAYRAAEVNAGNKSISTPGTKSFSPHLVCNPVALKPISKDR